MTYRKTAYGLSIASAFDLPELPDRAGTDGGHDVSIERAVLPEPTNQGARQIGPLIWASPNTLMFRIPDIATYLVEHGHRILVEPAAGADEDSVRLFLLGSGFGALLLQRGLFVLHGAAVLIDGAACIAVGPSGRGKSTLAEGLRRRGLAVLADDIVAIDADGLALPGVPRIKLWRDTVEKLGIDPAPLPRVRPGMEKFSIGIDGVADPERRPIRWVYALGNHHGTDVVITPATGADAFALLRDNSYRRRFVDALGLKTEQLRIAARIAATARLATIKRPFDGFALDATVDAILADVRR